MPTVAKFERVPCPHNYPDNCNCDTCKYDRGELGRGAHQNKAAYGRGGTSGAYGRSSYSFEAAEFDNLPALKRRRGDGAMEFFYGTNAVGEIDLNDRAHGHAVIKNGKLVYKRQPGESRPVVDRD